MRICKVPVGYTVWVFVLTCFLNFLVAGCVSREKNPYEPGDGTREYQGKVEPPVLDPGSYSESGLPVEGTLDDSSCAAGNGLKAESTAEETVTEAVEVVVQEALGPEHNYEENLGSEGEIVYPDNVTFAPGKAEKAVYSPGFRVSITSREILLEGEDENDGYGLYSYLLLRNEPGTDAEWIRYRKIIKAYSRGLKPSKYYRTVSGIPDSEINVTYFPLRMCVNTLSSDDYQHDLVSFKFTDTKVYPLFELLVNDFMGEEISFDYFPDNYITVNFSEVPADMMLEAIALASKTSIVRENGKWNIRLDESGRDPCASYVNADTSNYALPSALSIPDYYISSYDYARASLILSKFRGLSSGGPYIITSQTPLSTSESIDPDDEVLILDLSRVDDELFSEVFAYYQAKIADDRDVWAGGFDWEMIRILFQSALRMHGAQVLAAMDYTQDFFKIVKDASAATQ